ncbi:monofunctional biosynthetic peptidoglycan transglycosylase [bacterium]|nr:monofunctional biosynthetic peptidoglycan transglycosylase [bacterium]
MFKKVFKIVLKFLVFSFIFSLVSVISLRWIPPLFTPLMLQRKIEAMFSEKTKSSEIFYDWVAYDEISVSMPLAVVAAEDQNFPVHFGFDFQAIEKALEKNKKSKKVRGASTISQQVAKNVFLWSGRTWVRKGFEVYFTLLIEFFWGKKRILEVYLNVAEMGERVFGVEAAAQKFFKKPAKKLSNEQAALIAAVLPNPLRFKVLAPSNYVLKRKNSILNQMNSLGGTAYLKEIEK